MSGTNVPDIGPEDTCLECGKKTEPYGPWQAQDVVVCKKCMELYKQEIREPWQRWQKYRLEEIEQPGVMTQKQFQQFLANVVIAVIVAICLALAVVVWRWALDL